MADEATPQETIENPPVEVEAAAETIDSTPDVGADVQGTEPDTTATETDTGPDASTNPDIERLQKELEKVRKEAAANRVKGNEKAEQAAKDAADKAQRELVEQIGRTLGLIKDDVAPDPEQLLKDAAAREAQLAADRDSVAKELRSLRIEKALNASAEKHQGDLSILAPYLNGTGALTSLDPAADDFASQVDAIVSAAVEANPKLKKAPAQVAAPRSGGDLTGGNAAPKSNAAKSIDDLVRENREKRNRGRL